MMLCSKRGKINGPVRKTHSSVLVANSPEEHQITPFANFENRSHLAVRKTRQTCFTNGFRILRKVFFELIRGCLPPKQRSCFCERVPQSCIFSNTTQLQMWCFALYVVVTNSLIKEQKNIHQTFICILFLSKAHQRVRDELCEKNYINYCYLSDSLSFPFSFPFSHSRSKP